MQHPERERSLEDFRMSNKATSDHFDDVEELLERWAEHLAAPADPRKAAEIGRQAAAAATRWRRARFVKRVSLALAASMLLILGSWAAYSWRPKAHVPEYAAIPERTFKTLDGQKIADSTATIPWNLPWGIEGFISVVEIPPQGRPHVRPYRDELCQPVEVSRPKRPVRLSLLFDVPPAERTMVWLVLTDRRAAEAMTKLTRSWTPAAAREPSFRSALIADLQEAGFEVRAIGLASLSLASLTHDD
jgi:hypothetical protein